MSWLQNSNKNKNMMETAVFPQTPKQITANKVFYI